MARGSPSGNLPPRRLDDAVDDLPAEGTVMDGNVMAELEGVAAYEHAHGRGEFAGQRDDSGLALDPSDLMEDEGADDDGVSTDQHALPESAPQYREPGPSAPLPVAHRPTEQLSPQEAAAQYGTPPPVDEGTPLAAQPTMIYRDPATPEARVMVIGGNDRGREFELTSDEVTIGRGADCDIVLADIAVSRRHVVLFRDGVVYRARDQRSGNGTTVNGRKVAEALLANGDQIEIGNTVLRFVMTGDAYVAPAPPPPAAPPPGYTPATAAPQYAPQYPAYGQVPLGAPGVATLPPQPYPDGDPFAQAAASAASAYTPIVPPRAAPKKRGGKPAVAGAPRGAGPLTRLTSTRQGKLVTFGSLGLAFFLVSAAFVKRVVLPKRRAAVAAAGAATPALQAPEAAYEAGVRKFRDADWEGAKAAFDAVLQQVPDFQGAKKYAERCEVEIRSRDQLAAARTALEKSDFAAAKAALKEVDPASKAGDEGPKLSRTVLAREVETLLAAAKKLQAEEDFPGAKAKVAQALAVQPDNTEAVTLRAELEKARPKTEKERRREERLAAAAEKAAAREKAAAERRAQADAARDEKSRKKDDARREREAAKVAKAGKEPPKLGKEPPPKPGKEPPPKAVKEPKEPADDKVQASGPVSDKVAMNHYRAREWGMAIATLKQMAAKQKGKQATKTLAAAEDIRKVGQAFNRAEAQVGSNPAGAVGLYEQAAALDRRVGKGAHGPYLSGKLNKLSRTEAQKALQSGRYEAAYGLVKTAQRYGGDDATTRSVSSGLENKAKELFERAYQMKGQKPDEAKNLWRRVLKMVPSSSQWYAKSYKYLNETAGGRPKDEDE